MEKKELTNEEKAIISEKTRIANVTNSLHKLEKEYGAEKNKWLAKEEDYLSRMQKMALSIKSGREYIESIEKKLK